MAARGPVSLAAYFLKQTTSFGVHPMIPQSFSNVSIVIFLFFFKESSVLLSIPF